MFQVRSEAAEATSQLPLLNLRQGHRVHGPSLHVDKQLRWSQQLPLLPWLYLLPMPLIATVRVPTSHRTILRGQIKPVHPSAECVPDGCHDSARNCLLAGYRAYAGFAILRSLELAPGPERRDTSRAHEETIQVPRQG